MAKAEPSYPRALGGHSVNSQIIGTYGGATNIMGSSGGIMYMPYRGIRNEAYQSGYGEIDGYDQVTGGVNTEGETEVYGDYVRSANRAVGEVSALGGGSVSVGGGSKAHASYDKYPSYYP
eukprot:g370.t2